MSAKLGRRAIKAYLAAAIAGVATLGTALADERLTWAEGTGVVGSTLVAFAGVYLAPNGSDDDPTTSTPEVETWNDYAATGEAAPPGSTRL